jgi:hypothetical protein
MAFTWLSGFTVDGSVGIGTDLPSAKLQVGLGTSNQQSTIASIGGTGSSILNALSLVNTAGNAATNQGVMLTFHLNNAYSPTGQISVTTENAAGTVTDSSMKFWTYGSNYLPRMTIDSIGNVGIGVEDPQQKLQVEGNTWIKGIYYDSSGDAGASGDVLTSLSTGTTWVSAGTPGAGVFLPLAGGTMAGPTYHNDSVHSYWGNSNDFQIDHDGNHSVINNLTGNLYISNEANDADIELRSDDGAGGVTAYLTLDGSITKTIASKDIHFDGTVKATFGSNAAPNLSIYSDGTSSFIKEGGTGNFNIQTNGGGIFFEKTTGENMAVFRTDSDVELYFDGLSKFSTVTGGVSVTGTITVDSALLSNQENTDIDTGTETVANVAIATYTAAFFDFVVKKGTNIRSGTVYACHDGTNVEFTETSTQDLGDTSDVTLSVDISGTNMRLLATVTSDDWSVKSLIRAI